MRLSNELDSITSMEPSSPVSMLHERITLIECVTETLVIPNFSYRKEIFLTIATGTMSVVAELTRLTVELNRSESPCPYLSMRNAAALLRNTEDSTLMT